MADESTHKSIRDPRISSLCDTLSRDLQIRDAYMALLSALRLDLPPASGNSILVTSAAPAEGKTTIASSLAITAALAGHASLFIDADLQSTSPSMVGGYRNPGLTEFLTGEVSGSELILRQRLSTDHREGHSLSIMKREERFNTMLSLLDWTAARKVFTALALDYDIVFVDSPPILAADDALFLARIVDAAILVINTGTSNLDEVRQSRELLEKTGTPLLGAVLNRFEPKTHGHSNKPYRDYHRR